MFFQQAEEELARLGATLTTLEMSLTRLSQSLAELNVLVQDLKDRVAALESSEPPPPPPPPPPEENTGVWVSAEELAALPMVGAEWDSLKKAADAASDSAAIVADQDNNQDVAILAVALVAARSGLQTYRDKALSMLTKTAAVDWRADSRMNMLEWGRNFLALYIAADVLGIQSGPIYDFLKDALKGTKDEHHGGKVISAEDFAWESGSNSYSQAAAGAIAGAIYTGDKAMLDRLYVKFQRFAGDRTSPATITINEWNTFETDESNPVGIQNKGATKDGCNVDGAVGNDVGRSNGTPCQPVYTFYGSTGSEGWVPAAFMLHRQGYPALTEQDSAIKRAYLYWKYLDQFDSRWDDPAKAKEIRHLLKKMYPDLSIAVNYPTTGGRTVGYTGWTHPV